MTLEELEKAHQLISANWSKANFLEEEIAKLNSFKLGKGKQKIRVKIQGNLLSVEKVTRFSQRDRNWTITLNDKEYIVKSGPSSHSHEYHEEFFKNKTFIKAFDYLLFAFITPGEHFLNKEKDLESQKKILENWKRVLMLEKELEQWKKFTFKTNDKNIEVSIEKDVYLS
jgi:hypothetical protein